jgi:transposase
VLVDKETRTYERRYNVDKPQRYSFRPQVEQEKLILDYGDTYALWQVITQSGLGEIYASVLPNEQDTLNALLCFKLLVGSAFDNAQTWYSGNYACLLFPKAQLDGRRISELLKRLGDEGVQRKFFELHLSKTIGIESEVIIDSTGLPNEIDIPLSQFGNHGGESEQETRLILVIDQQTGKPLYFRLVAGNIVDVSTLITTIAEFKKLGVKSTFALLDGGYYSENNIKALYGNNISFLTRLNSGRVLYKELIRDSVPTLEAAQNVVRYNNRALFVERRDVDLWGNKGFAYICCDIKRKGIETDRFLLEALEDKLSNEEVTDKLKFKGKFVLLSNRELSPRDIIPLYYTRQSAEQLFGIGKSQLNFLPLRVHSEETLRGLLLLNFMALTLQNHLQSLLNGKYTVEKAMDEMANLHCKTYPNGSYIIQEPTKRQKDILSLLNVTTPNSSGV